MSNREYTMRCILQACVGQRYYDDTVRAYERSQLKEQLAIGMEVEVGDTVTQCGLGYAGTVKKIDGGMYTVEWCKWHNESFTDWALRPSLIVLEKQPDLTKPPKLYSWQK